MLAKKVRFYTIILVAITIAVVVYGFNYKSSESVSYYAALTNKQDVAKAVYIALGNNNAEIVDQSLIFREQYLKVTGGRLDMSDPQQAATAKDLIWAVWTKGSSVSNLPMFEKEQTSAILGFDAATGLFIGVYGGTAETMAPFTTAFTEIPDLDGTINIVPKEIKLPDTVPPTATPIPQE